MLSLAAFDCLSAVLLAPVHRRGWVIQERALSPRNLHFGRHMVYWECRYQISSETVDPSANHQALPICIGQQIGNPHDSARWNILSPWISLVDRYSGAALTKAEDKLVAVSALARRVEPAITHKCG